MFLAWATSTRPRHTTKEEALRCIVSLVDWTNGLETYFYCILRVTVRKSSQARSVKVSELGLLGLLSLRGLVGCSNPLHEESETHERMFLRTDMGRCHVQRESLRGCCF